uniref:Transmembrane protein n=1 Tax=Medicago truncatula TaxID=3880 RepID=I3SZD5_MEDTR|nr:unknown [Medicago truncatula]
MMITTIPIPTRLLLNVVLLCLHIVKVVLMILLHFLILLLVNLLSHNGKMVLNNLICRNFLLMRLIGLLFEIWMMMDEFGVGFISGYYNLSF